MAWNCFASRRINPSPTAAVFDAIPVELLQCRSSPAPFFSVMMVARARDRPNHLNSIQKAGNTNVDPNGHSTTLNLALMRRL